MKTGRIDVHAHLIPGVDDGCASLEESLACARLFVQAGYTHAFCTPHIDPAYPKNTVPHIRAWTEDLQHHVDDAGIPLRLLPGAEIALHSSWPALAQLDPAEVATYALNGKYVLFDFWAKTLPDYLGPAVKHFQSLGLIPILAHPERIKATQSDPAMADRLLEMGMLLQCNTWCLSEPPGTPMREMSERWLRDGKYFLLGTDCHHADSLPIRLEAVQQAIQMVGQEAVAELTITNPLKLLPVPPRPTPPVEPERPGKSP